MRRATQAVGDPDLWELVRGSPWIDPRELLRATERQLRQPLRDFRTRLLVRDSLDALERRWGAERLRASLSGDVADEARRIRSEDLGEPGFPLLERRMADATEAATILQFLRELGLAVRSPARLDVGGSSALILRGLLTRATDAVDAVDEVPAVIRAEHDLLERLASRYRLRLAHFQSHYLPEGWRDRVQSLGRFEKVDVFLVDPLDIFVGKLFSKREKDLDDLRSLLPQQDAGAIAARLKSAGQKLLADAGLRADAPRSWYILFGEPLPA